MECKREQISCTSPSVVVAGWPNARSVGFILLIIIPSHHLCRNRVLALLVEPLREKGFHTLRFNSRGVGSSAGWASLTGTNEGKDLEALVQWVFGQIANIESLVLIVSAFISTECWINSVDRIRVIRMED